MEFQKNRAKEYIVEAELTLESAKAIFKKSSNELPLWALVVKNSYDAMEQAISSLIVLEDQIVPKEHPAKILKFVEIYGREDSLVKKLLSWLSKRARAQYVDITKNNEISVPHKIFNKENAEQALGDAEEIIKTLKNKIFFGPENAQNS